MSFSENEARITGNLGQDPQIRFMPSGDRVANLSIATNKQWIKDGQKQSKTEWHNVVCYGALAKSCEDYLRQGRNVTIKGELHTRMYEKNGVKFYRTEIVANRIGFNGSPNQSASDE